MVELITHINTNIHTYTHIYTCIKDIAIHANPIKYDQARIVYAYISYTQMLSGRGLISVTRKWVKRVRRYHGLLYARNYDNIRLRIRNVYAALPTKYSQSAPAVHVIL